MNRTRSNGFTLLEVLLALALTALLLVALGMAVDFHFRVLNAGRAHVEEAQLARVLLRRIGDDLRSAVCASPDNLQQAAAAGAIGQTQAGGQGGEGGQQPAAGQGGAGVQSQAGGQAAAGGQGGAGNAQNNATQGGQTTTTYTAPGIYGDSASLQIDVGRLPSPYQLQALYSAAPGMLPPTSFGDVKTVTYFTSGPQGPVGMLAMNLASAVPNQQGLIRCEQDRAVALYQLEQGGGGVSPDLNAVPLAPEVAGIQFSYFDGVQWWDTWDTTQNGSLPLAVRVTIYITPAQTSGAPQWLSGLAGNNNNALMSGNTLAYSLLVFIPLAQASQVSGACDNSASNGSGSNNNTGSNGGKDNPSGAAGGAAASNGGTSSSGGSKTSKTSSGGSKSGSGGSKSGGGGSRGGGGVPGGGGRGR